MKLLPEIKVYLIFHVSLLKSFMEDILWSDHNQAIMPPLDLVGGHSSLGEFTGKNRRTTCNKK
jgi:hypothetical protein